MALAPTLDLDRLLWLPGEKTIFLPPPPRIATLADFQVGDVFTIAGYFATNPRARKNELQRFVVTGKVVDDGRVIGIRLSP